MAHKKSGIILITALIVMAFVSAGCERSYAPIDETQATPTTEGAFPEALPADMEGVFESGAQTATALANESAAPAADAATATPSGDNVELTPDGEASPTVDPALASPTSTLPVLDATTAPSATPSISSGSIPATYTLKKGEFPYCIARRFNIDPGELLNLNGISTAQAGVYQPGLSLSIPQSGAPFPSNRARNAHPITYIVPEATTVYGVACYFGDVDPSAILSANASITNADLIPAGTSLQIP